MPRKQAPKQPVEQAPEVETQPVVEAPEVVTEDPVEDVRDVTIEDSAPAPEAPANKPVQRTILETGVIIEDY